ncbi:MAG: hypothetical protein IJ523_09800 [Succinivibrionaceae bacterium]|nr:hypothetical protein [Succinivibrionaceae bacterium]
MRIKHHDEVTRERVIWNRIYDMLIDGIGDCKMQIMDKQGKKHKVTAEVTHTFRTLIKRGCYFDISIDGNPAIEGYVVSKKDGHTSNLRRRQRKSRQAS